MIEELPPRHKTLCRETCRRKPPLASRYQLSYQVLYRSFLKWLLGLNPRGLLVPLWLVAAYMDGLLWVGGAATRVTDKANQAHLEVGRKVRKAIRGIGGTMPDDLPVYHSIKPLEKKRAKELPDPRGSEAPPNLRPDDPPIAEIE